MKRTKFASTAAGSFTSPADYGSLEITLTISTAKRVQILQWSV
ncbi:hypothetical protein [Streptococcus sp. 2022WUSS037]